MEGGAAEIDTPTKGGVKEEGGAAKMTVSSGATPTRCQWLGAPGIDPSVPVPRAPVQGEVVEVLRLDQATPDPS